MNLILNFSGVMYFMMLKMFLLISFSFFSGGEGAQGCLSAFSGIKAFNEKVPSQDVLPKVQSSPFEKGTLNFS